jgi:hypothetical protein
MVPSYILEWFRRTYWIVGKRREGN